MSGSGISWAICKSASRSRQITTPATHRSVFLQAGCPFCRPTNSVNAIIYNALIIERRRYHKIIYCTYKTRRSSCVAVRSRRSTYSARSENIWTTRRFAISSYRTPSRCSTNLPTFEWARCQLYLLVLCAAAHATVRRAAKSIYLSVTFDNTLRPFIGTVF